MNAQSLIHWLEQGRGAQALKVLAVLLVLLAISVTVAFKQFHGPRTEETLRQADLGRSLAEGKGFTSSINYPQVQATLERRGRLFSQQQAMPEVYHAPGYAMVVAATLALLPDGMYQSAFKAAPKPPDGFGADYVLLGLNILLLWIAAGQTWRLGAKLFESRVGLLAGGVVLISSPIWAHVVAVDGTALAMVFLLAFFQFLMRGDDAVERGESGRGAWIGVGVVAGLLFLTDYPWGMLAVVAGVHAGIRGRLSGAFWVLGVALLVVSPWLIRNVEVIGSPLALAGQDLALRADDPTANPVEWRNTLTSKAPEVSLNKLGNKTLTALKQTLSEQLWAGGG